MKDQDQVDIEKLKESMDVERIIKDVRSQKWTEDYRRGVATLVDIKTRLVRVKPLTQTQEENESLKFKLMAADRGLELAQKEENLELTQLRADLAAAREALQRIQNLPLHSEPVGMLHTAQDIATEALSTTGAVEGDVHETDFVNMDEKDEVRLEVEPGEGWRLLEAGEPLQAGDGYLHPDFPQTCWIDYTCRPDIFRGHGKEFANTWPWRRKIDAARKQEGEV